MDFVMGFPLILLLLSSGHTYPQATEQPSDKCYIKCPAGYHKVGDCNNQAAKMYRCRKCDNNSYTALENSHDRCLLCQRQCEHLEVEIQACNFTSNRVCDCQEGYYNEGTEDFKNCLSCTLGDESRVNTNPDYEKKCQHNKRKDTLAQPPTPSTTSLPTSVTVTATKATLSNKTENPVQSQLNINSMPWLILWVVVVIFVVAFLLLLLITLLINQNRIPCWRTKKGVEEQVKRLNEHHSLQGSRPTTQMFHISEETPIMAHSHTSPMHLLPSAEPEAKKQDEQSEHLPAIVLYAIIKEVPLRRWKEFLRLLSVADQQLERVELETGFGLSSMEKQYQMLRLWSQQSTASLRDVFSALHHMDLSGCAQLLQENLQKLE
ncbi:tumor necrosis factor receptor superfamily member 1A [Solea solea]|uniref:tumor necrosis factor receptor superfamily member 1A n=1 Tax=Solea solea TaxID=90069 RepID=UPI00272CBAC7|nr:tumor necrosis factor receptor superfamily member 1A [Solea solea]